jgi:hypothetical protein
LKAFLRFALIATESSDGERPSQLEEETVRARADRVFHVREVMLAKGYAPPAIDPEVKASLERWTRLV